MKNYRSLLLTAFVVSALACNFVLPRPAPAPAQPTTPPQPSANSNPAPALVGGAIPCPGEQPAFVTDSDVRQVPMQDQPAARTPFRDPTFGTCMVRVTDSKADLAPGDGSAGMKNEYSRVQSFNADGSRLIARGILGTWYLYDAQTLAPIGQLPIDTDPRWSTTDPNLLYYSSGTSLMSHNIQSSQGATVHDFAADLPGQTIEAVWTRYKGSPSMDGRYWAFMAEDQDWLASALLVYDLQQDRVVANRDLRGWPDEARDFDNVTMSPLGNYVLVEMNKYCDRGQLGTDADPCGFMAYDRDLKNGRGVLRLVGHGDAALDAAGQEVFVFQDVDTDYISMLDLASGQVTPLWQIDFSQVPLGFHLSGRAFQHPGWAVISSHDGNPTSYTWMDDQIFAIELKEGGRKVRLAHTQSIVDENMEHDYWAEPHVSANQDMTRIVFTSNWGRSGTEEVEMYMLYLPAGWTDQVQ